MLITSEYLTMQKQLHENPGYGTSGMKSAELVKLFNDHDILDYGCGKRTLEKALGFYIFNYDPAIEGLENNNQPHNILYCGDVLEHIEPHLLDDVLQDIRRCMLVRGLLVASTVAAKKTLSDGRNAHLIIENADWWRDKLKQYFSITSEYISGKNAFFWVE